MHAITLLSRHLPPDTAEPLPGGAAPGVCCITGLAGPTIARRRLLGASFRDQAVLAAPHSDRVSTAAWSVFTHHQDRGKKRGFYPERQSSWICDGGGFIPLDRAGVREYVVGAGVYEPPWCAYATTSYKKHGALYAPVNTGDRAVWQWEQIRVDCTDHDRVMATWQRLREAQDAGIGRPLMESLEPYPAQIRKVGLAVWQDFEAWARPRQRAPLYRFLVYLLPSAEELRG